MNSNATIEFKQSHRRNQEARSARPERSTGSPAEGAGTSFRIDGLKMRPDDSAKVAWQCHGLMTAGDVAASYEQQMPVPAGDVTVDRGVPNDPEHERGQL